MKEPIDDNNCFVCGQQNAIGLHLTFEYEDDVARSTVSIPSHFQGWQGIIHGGIVATLLDEIMAKATRHAGFPAITVEITVTFKNPTPADKPLMLSGRIVERRRKTVVTEGTLCDESGKLLARAQAVFYTG